MSLRRLLRFKLRTLLIVFTVLTGVLGWHAYGVRQQRQAVEAIFEHGGWAGYDFEESKDSKWLYADGESRVPPWLLETVGVDFFHAVVTVKLPVVVDPGIATPPDGDRLRELMTRVGSLPKVATIHLADNFATDEALLYVGCMPRVTTLHIADYGHISPQAMSYVVHIPTVNYWCDYKLPGKKY